MKVRYLSTLLLVILMATSCIESNENPLLQKWNTVYNTPPFSQIEDEHYLPAFIESAKIHKEEIQRIIDNPEPPSFENTIVALEQSGELLERTSKIFGAMLESMNSEKITEIAKIVMPKLAEHQDEINLNPKLFERVKIVFNQRKSLNLTNEQMILLENYYKDFVRGGANLNAEDKENLTKINARLSVLSIQFSENTLNETNEFELVIEDKKDLAGLPESVIIASSETAKERGKDGKWVFTTQKSSMIPFLQYAENRKLREKLYRAYFMKGDKNDKYDNKEIVVEIAKLRLQKAKLLGYKNHAEFVLEENMAKNPQNVYERLNQLWKPAIKRATEERDEMQRMIRDEGNSFQLMPWDWWFYSEKVKLAKYNLNEDELRPYFKLENVIQGAFTLANELFGIKFIERNDIEKYHPDVKVFEVTEADGKHIGILYTDYFPRQSKRSGAWMEEFQTQHKIDGKNIYPIIYNVGNFSKPTADKPSLLSLDETLTLFHEFGHALHGLLSDCNYESLAGTQTPIDFVEFPSQLMENWALHPDFIKKYAKHYQTGEVIPDELIAKLKNAELFNQGFATVEYLAAAFLDMDWHTITDEKNLDVIDFENASMKRIGLIDEIIPRYRTTYFNHIFGGGYSAGYYSYIWAELLDADAFAYFEQSGNILNKEIAKKYRDFIISKGGTENSMELYKKFRGKEPGIEALLKKRGLN